MKKQKVKSYEDEKMSDSLTQQKDAGISNLEHYSLIRDSKLTCIPDFVEKVSEHANTRLSIMC